MTRYACFAVVGFNCLVRSVALSADVAPSFGEPGYINPKHTGTHTIYGYVVDQHGAPVQDAEIEYSWKSMLPDLSWEVNDGMARTDVGGNWHFSATGFQIGIRNVKKKGYEYRRSSNPLYNDPDLEGKTSREKPLILPMRKKGETTFLLRRDVDRLVSMEKPTSDIRYLDLVSGEIWSATEPPSRYAVNLHTDMVVRVEYDRAEVSNSYRVVFSTPDVNSGLATNNVLLFEAPTNGYTKEVSVRVLQTPEYIYLKTRSNSMYSRVALDRRYHPNGEIFWLYSRIVLNPYGERNFEDADEDLKGCWDLRARLKKEALDALRAGKLAPKPDLKKLIAEERAKPEKK